MKQLIVGTAAGEANLNEAAARLAELVEVASADLDTNFAAVKAAHPAKLMIAGERTATHQMALDTDGRSGATVFITVLVTATTAVLGQMSVGDDES